MCACVHAGTKARCLQCRPSLLESPASTNVQFAVVNISYKKTHVLLLTTTTTTYFLTNVMPNTHRRVRRRDETVLLRRCRRCEHDSLLAHDDCRWIRSTILETDQTA